MSEFDARLTFSKRGSGRIMLIVLMLTFAWLASAALYAANIPEKSLFKLSQNEFGDFLGGVTAPLAFLWLIAATFLQREELQHNTATLELQAKELRLSVEQLTRQANVMQSEYESRRADEANARCAAKLTRLAQHILEYHYWMRSAEGGPAGRIAQLSNGYFQLGSFETIEARINESRPGAAIQSTVAYLEREWNNPDSLRSNAVFASQMGLLWRGEDMLIAAKEIVELSRYVSDETLRNQLQLARVEKFVELLSRLQNELRILRHDSNGL